MPTEDGFSDMPPRGAHGSARQFFNGTRRGAEQDGVDALRETGVGKHLDQIVDEMGTADRADAFELGRSRAFKKHPIAAETEPGLIEEAVIAHPAKRCLAKIDSLRVVMAELRLVADDKDVAIVLSAGPKEVADTIEQKRPGDAGTVNMALQSLPRDLAARRLADVISHRLLRPDKPGFDQRSTLRGSNEDLIVIAKSIVEIDADAHRLLHHSGFSRMSEHSAKR
jgi:hypothetical protein